jgi:hypothetical protein
MTSLIQLRRLRWIVRLALTLGVAASIAANVLHAHHNLISQTIAAWPPLALLLTVELISRVPVHRRGLAAVRVAATATIASIAAWVSYWHMAGVTARYGETSTSAHLMPISVDGLIVVASISLVELAGHIRALDAASAATAQHRPAAAKRATTTASQRPVTSTTTTAADTATALANTSGPTKPTNPRKKTTRAAAKTASAAAAV